MTNNVSSSSSSSTSSTHIQYLKSFEEINSLVDRINLHISGFTFFLTDPGVFSPDMHSAAQANLKDTFNQITGSLIQLSDQEYALADSVFFTKYTKISDLVRDFTTK